MAVAYQSAGTNAGAATAAIIPKPTGLAVSDLMVGMYESRGSSTVAPTGWTLLQDSGTLYTLARLTVLWRIADAADVAAASFTFTAVPAGSVKYTSSILRITGHDATTPFPAGSDAVGGNTSASTAHVAPSVTGQAGGLHLVYYAGQAAGTWSLLTGYTKPYTDLATTGGGSNGGSSTQYKALAASGATGALTSTGPSGQYSSVSAAVAPGGAAAAAEELPILSMARTRV